MVGCSNTEFSQKFLVGKGSIQSTVSLTKLLNLQASGTHLICSGPCENLVRATFNTNYNYTIAYRFTQGPNTLLAPKRSFSRFEKLPLVLVAL
jgi:hypothetical protein